GNFPFGLLARRVIALAITNLTAASIRFVLTLTAASAAALIFSLAFTNALVAAGVLIVFCVLIIVVVLITVCVLVIVAVLIVLLIVVRVVACVRALILLIVSLGVVAFATALIVFLRLRLRARRRRRVNLRIYLLRALPLELGSVQQTGRQLIAAVLNDRVDCVIAGFIPRLEVPHVAAPRMAVSDMQDFVSHHRFDLRQGELIHICRVVAEPATIHPERVGRWVRDNL